MFFSIKKKGFLKCVLLLVSLIIGAGSFILPNLPYQAEVFNEGLNLNQSGYWDLTGGITINDAATGVSDQATINTTYEWCNGAGIIDDPYIIENVTINAGNSGSCISIYSSNVYFIIRNCTLIDGGPSGFDSGIFMNGVQNGLIENNTCYNSRCGIVLQSCSNNLIKQNFVYSTSFVGIYFLSGNNNDAYNNTIIGTNRGLAVYDESNANLSLNTLSNSGIYIQGDNTEVNTHDIDTTNLVNGNAVYYYVDENGIDNSNFTDPGQIILVGCDNCNISGFNFKNTIRGIQIFYSNNSRIFGNDFSNIFDVSIYNQGNYKINISYNSIVSSSEAITSYSATNCTIRNNNIISCGMGIALLMNSNNNSINDNTISQCTTCINLDTSLDNLIQYNELIGAGINGFYMSYASGNEIALNSIDGLNRGFFLTNNADLNIFRENNITSCSNYGVFIYQSSCDNNLFYENSFESNNLHVEDDGTDNYYNNSVIGNFWDNYLGTDLDDNGIGDDPFEIQTGLFDYLPIFEDGDSIAPQFSISSPFSGISFNEPPTVQLSFDAPSDSNKTWYTILGSGANHSFVGDSFEVDGASWAAQEDGPLIIRVYANDSSNNIASNDLSIIKDTTEPVLTITSPNNNTIYTATVPELRVFITEANIDRVWYTINDDTTKYFVSSPISGVNIFSIENSTWNALPDGDYILRIHVNDTIGYYDSLIFRIIKDFENSPHYSGIPGYELGTFITVLSIMSITIAIIRRKCKN